MSVSVVVLLALCYPIVGGAIAARMAIARIAARTGLSVEIARSRASIWSVELSGLKVGDVGRPLLTVERVVVPFSVLFGPGRIEVVAPRLVVLGGFDELKKLRQDFAARGRSGGSESRVDSTRRLPVLSVLRGSVRIESGTDGRHLFIREISGEIDPGKQGRITMLGVAGEMGDGENLSGSSFGAESLLVSAPLTGLRPTGLPEIEVVDGYLQAMPQLGLTGISGHVRRNDSQPETFLIDLSGSYGGSQETLWRAEGSVVPGKDLSTSSGTIRLRAEKFSLARIANVLPPVIQNPAQTSVDAELDVGAVDGQIRITGRLGVVGLSIFHEGLAAEPVVGMNLSTDLKATFTPTTHTVHIEKLWGRIGNLQAQVHGSVQMLPEPFNFDDRAPLPWTPRIDLVFEVPKVSCANLLSSFPSAILPTLQGFQMTGQFETHLETHIDFQNLEALELNGKVGIDGCKVVTAPEHVAALVDTQAVVTQEVEIPPPWDDKTNISEVLMFAIGPDNEDFVPYESISVHLINAVLTTEDSRFFQHDGFATTEFKTALKRNLASGRFRFGASSITMQTVKNLLLSHEKTLSRKLQELFLVWYIEQILTKERILELYLNAIEFGPRLYGVGPAARHYFGKSASDLSVAEAAFLASLLPSPKRRYAHYCKGAISDKWQKHLKRVITRMHERDRLTDEEFALALETMPAFNLTERTMDEKNCLAWIARIVDRGSEPAVTPDDSGDAGL
ncbi:MAG: biosynthetic peptidoglycan transglycosylase [Deltaproteobacteria bacterium]|nr:biosynthetic peptidoglycan transglycosylase [Deltaproteobacteria bacterium]